MTFELWIKNNVFQYDKVLVFAHFNTQLAEPCHYSFYLYFLFYMALSIYVHIKDIYSYDINSTY